MIIIPDVHGRSFWKAPVHDNLGKEHILFLGDYLDPYEDELISPRDAYDEFERITRLKEKHPEDVTLLLGNHDVHYLTDKGHGGRYDYIRGGMIKHFLQDHADLFQLTFSAEIGGKKFLFTHAGILAGWMGHNKEYLRGATPDTIGPILNEIWAHPSSWPVLFSILADVPYSRWGRCRFGSPTWSDVDDIHTDEPELPGYYQIFGHSQQESSPVITEYFACLDCRKAFRLTDDGTITDKL